MEELTEKQKIELSSAEAFISHYNLAHSRDYEIKSVAKEGEVPDVLAKDTQENNFGIEVTLTADNDRDIASILGRSSHKSVEALQEHLKRVREGNESIKYNSLQGNVLEMLLKTIEKKLNKRYGKNVALLVRDTSGVPWHWEDVMPNVKFHLLGRHIPFDRGIWLLSRCKSKLWCVYEENSSNA